VTSRNNGCIVGSHHRQIVMLEPAADFHQRPDRIAQPQQVAPQQIEALDLRLRHGAGEHLRFHRSTSS
jgi:hypothetical protein